MKNTFQRLNPTFARLLSNENIKVRVGISTEAYFDLGRRELHVPNWGLSTEAVMDMVVAHEVGHALFTGQAEWRHGQEVAGIQHAILNIVEDSRIEKLIQRKFPGLQRDFAEAYFYLHNDLDLFGIRRVHVPSLSFADRYNLYFKVGTMSGAIFHNDEERAMVEEGAALETWEDVLALAKKMQEYCDRNKNQKLLPSPQQTRSKKLSDKLSEANKLPQPVLEEEDETESSDDDENIFIENDNTAEDLEIDNTLDDTDYSAPGITDQNLRKNEDDLIGAGGNRQSDSDFYQNVGRQQWSGKLKERKYNPASEVKTVINLNRSSITEMVAEFERKKAAWKSINATPSRTGRIDTNKLAQHTFNPNIFLDKKIVQNAKSHGVVVLLDNSASMSSFWYAAKARAIELAEFCSRVGIRCVVTTFQGLVLDTADGNWRYLDEPFGDSNLGKTPISRSILCCEENLRAMYDAGIQRCSLIVITDGEEADGDANSVSKRFGSRTANFMEAQRLYDEVTNVAYTVPYPTEGYKNRRQLWRIRAMQLHSVAIDMLKNRLHRHDLNVSMIMLASHTEMVRTNCIFGNKKHELYDNHGFNAVVRVPIENTIRKDFDHSTRDVKWEEISVRERMRQFSNAAQSATGASFMYRVIAANIAKSF